MKCKWMWLGALLFMTVSAPVFGQATAVFNGRVVDQGGAVIPGATVTVKNSGTGITRNATTNDAGLYTIPALEPGSYDVRVEKTGFAPSEKKDVTLITSTTLALDFTLGVAGTIETIEVTGEAPLIETTQSEVSASLQTSEVQNLPMLNRNFSGLVELIPGARPAAVYNPTKAAMGSGISVGGGVGRNVEVNVDGADNRDDIEGGPMQNFTLEGVEEFKLLTHEYGPQYGRTNGSVLQIASKSGTNQPHGSAFILGRNDAMTAIDYFTQTQGLPKTSYSQEQFGGSFGGPIIKNRWFFFGAYERDQEDYFQTVPANLYNQVALLVPYGAVPAHEVPQPFRDNMYTLKTDFQINSHHSLFVRWAQQLNHHDNDQLTVGLGLVAHPDLSVPSIDTNDIWSIVAGETWIISNNSVNQILFQRNSMATTVGIVGSNAPIIDNLTFASVSIGQPSSTTQIFLQSKVQFQDNFSRQIGKHSLKIGGDFSFYPEIGVHRDLGLRGGITFFDDPSTIVASQQEWAANPSSCTTAACGKYPQGFLTPGAVASIAEGTRAAGGPLGMSDMLGAKQVGLYVGDDWKVAPHLTLNLGLRYDVDVNFYNQSQAAGNRTYLALQAIGNTYGRLPKTPLHDISPRFGFAWDIGGNGKNVLRASFGIFFDQSTQVNAFTQNEQDKATLALSSTYVNTSVGAGQLATYVYGVSPLPLGPPALPTQLPAGGNTSGSWFDPGIRDPYNEQFHIGYTRQLTERTVISADYTHILGIHEFRNENINPLENAWDPTDADQHIPWGTRRLGPAFAGIGEANILGGITVTGSNDRSQYNELIVHLEHRYSRATFQASYILSSAYGFGGSVGNIAGGANAAPVPINQDQPFGPGEWGPSPTDERHRVVLSGVFDLPWGIQVSPIFQFGSARPYTLTAGTDLNKDGTNNDLYVNPATGQSVSVGSQRGDPTWDWDTRVSKFFNLRSEARRIGVFAEIYNITNRVNFGNNYQGNAHSSLFETPLGYAPGLPTSRQLQLGARFIF